MKHVLGSLVTFFCTFALLSCDADNGAHDTIDKEGISSVDGVSGAADLTLGASDISLEEDRLIGFRFHKQAGAHYTVTLTTTHGDLDLYGHWRSDFSPWSGRLSSTRGGRAEDQIEFTASESGNYYLIVHAYLAGYGRVVVDEELDEPVSEGYPPIAACRSCSNQADCQAMVDDLVRSFPDYASRGKAITFSVAGPSGYCDGFTSGVIRCPQDFLNRNIVTNKLLFHELSHQMKAGNIKSGSSGACSNGDCGSSELQASLLEDYYFAENCLGGNYTFTDRNGVARVSNDFLDVLAQTSITEAELWDFAMGREDTLSDHTSAFGVNSSSELYWSQHY